MKNRFLEIEVGDKVVVAVNKEDYYEHLIEVERIDYHKENITENNLEGMICYGRDLDEDEWGEESVTVVTEHNFNRFATEREKLWVCEHCLAAIESREGNQATLKCSVEETDVEESRCDWCEMMGFDTLYELV